MKDDVQAPDDEVVEDVRLCIYRWFAATGQLPPVHRLVEIAGNVTRLALAIDTLAARRHLARDDAGEIALAHPFASRSFGFSVMSATTLWWGGCAWDSFALPHLLQIEEGALVATRCPGCDKPLAWLVGPQAPPRGDEVAHFLVPVERMWQDVLHTCANQRLFCGHDCLTGWLAVRKLAEGCRLDLATLWRLASHWYDGRLERGYARRAPAAARHYLRSVGLRGSFWGL